MQLRDWRPGLFNRPHAEFRRHEPDQTPRQRFLECATGEGLIFQREERHDPPGVIDRPVAVTPARGDRSPESVLEFAAREQRTNAATRGHHCRHYGGAGLEMAMFAA
jgi:fructose-1,6-bisphosphatase/inositol monophosphatase family enzyme